MNPPYGRVIGLWIAKACHAAQAGAATTVALIPAGMSSSPTGEQDLTIQGEALTAAGCTIIREEKRSGTSREGRQELETLLAFLRKGDVLMAPLHARSTEYRSRAEGQGRGAQGD
jgi:hypothetical protein